MDEISQELNPREMTAKVNEENENLIEIFDTKSGDLLGSRELSNKIISYLEGLIGLLMGI